VRPRRRIRLALEGLEARTLLSFAAPTVFDLGAAPKAVAVGHFEGQGAPLDVVTANANGTLSVLLGDGHGGLQNPITLTVGGNPNAVAVGDFLGNGLDDIVAANTDGTVSVLLSNGNGTFQATERLAAGGTPVGVAVGKFTGDGKLDIVTANFNGTVSFLAGNGDGSFGGPIVSTVSSRLTSVAVGDFDHDGTLDLAVGTDSGVDVLQGNGNGTFQVKQVVPFFYDPQDPSAGTVPVNAVQVADFQGNGTLDILGDDRLLLGKGDGTFKDPVQLPLGPFAASAVIAGDFTSDGKADVVTSNLGSSTGSPTLTLLAGNGDGTFQPARTVKLGETANALAVGDFRGNGTLDLVLASNLGANTLTLLPGNGDGTFAITPTVASPNLPTIIASGVFTGSGKPDLVSAGNGGNAVVLLNNGDGTFRTGPTLPLSTVSTGVVTGSFTSDGNQDIALATAIAGHGTVNVYLGNGDGTFQAPLSVDLGFDTNTFQLVAGDFNGDGRLDLAVLYKQFNTGQLFVKVLQGNGDGTFQDAQTIEVPTDSFSLAAGHFHGPGTLDLVTTGTRGSVSILTGNGDGTFQNPTTMNLGQDIRGVAAGALHGNGKDDLVLVTQGHLGALSEVIVLPGNGDGTFGTPQVFQFHNSIFQLGGPVVADFFGDGKLSVAVSTGEGNVSVLRGNGDGTFQAPVNYLVNDHGTQPTSLVAADFNGDGKPDLAVTGFISNSVAVLLNTSPPPDNGAPRVTTTTLTTDVNPAVNGQPVTLTATVTASLGTPVGSVTFFDGTTILGVVAVDPNGQAVLVVPLNAGVHSLSASFAGIAPFTASTSATVSETVNKAATTTTVSADVIIPSFVEFTVTVLPVAPGAGVPTGTIILFDGNTIIGTAHLDNHGHAFFDIESLQPGKHTITASYSGDDGFLASVSDPLILNL
jgi:hypothetical protein